ncbi:unnamed protein product [Chrysoparadoxa australica]
MLVAVRIRPLSESEILAGKQKCCEVLHSKAVAITKSAVGGAYLRSQQGTVNEYMFDAAYDSDATQADVYQGTAKKFINDVLDGFPVTVFAYGATGAGKTHTMMGSTRIIGTKLDGSDANEVSGIVPQSLVDVFRGIAQRRERAYEQTETWTVKVGYLEVYNEQIRDLLEPTGKNLKINEDPAKGIVVVQGLTEKLVEDAASVLDLLMLGNTNRKTEATQANQVSSRSHAVLQVRVTCKRLDSFGNDTCTEGKLSLIDLAGSERASATNNTGALLRQGANINKSLLSLANCINALSANARGQKQTNVKYRDSKLTHLLKSSLEGKARCVMIANINPSHLTYDDSHNTLKYANRAKNIKMAASKSVETKEASWPQREARLLAENEHLRETNTALNDEITALRKRMQVKEDAQNSPEQTPRKKRRMSPDQGSPQPRKVSPPNPTNAKANAELEELREELASAQRSQQIVVSQLAAQGTELEATRAAWDGTRSDLQAVTVELEETKKELEDALNLLEESMEKDMLLAEEGGEGSDVKHELAEAKSQLSQARRQLSEVQERSSGPSEEMSESNNAKVQQLEVRVKELNEGREVMLCLIDNLKERQANAEECANVESQHADECMERVNALESENLLLKKEIKKLMAGVSRRSSENKRRSSSEGGVYGNFQVAKSENANPNAQHIELNLPSEDEDGDDYMAANSQSKAKEIKRARSRRSSMIPRPVKKSATRPKSTRAARESMARDPLQEPPKARRSARLSSSCIR